MEKGAGKRICQEQVQREREKDSSLVIPAGRGPWWWRLCGNHDKRRIPRDVTRGDLLPGTGRPRTLWHYVVWCGRWSISRNDVLLVRAGDDFKSQHVTFHFCSNAATLRWSFRWPRGCEWARWTEHPCPVLYGQAIKIWGLFVAVTEPSLPWLTHSVTATGN